MYRVGNVKGLAKKQTHRHRKHNDDYKMGNMGGRRGKGGINGGGRSIDLGWWTYDIKMIYYRIVHLKHVWFY